jgi:ADP-ribosyl-[dinitrogen reductase] hydrolase
MNDRAKGALLGLAVGDALGTTYEFQRIEQAAYPTLAIRPATDVVGGGPFALAAGQITDDTQMAVCLARSLAEHGELDLEDVGRRYVAWMGEAFDIGNQTRGSLSRLAEGDRSAGLEVWRGSEHRAAGNGSLMRTAPIGVAYAHRKLPELLDAAMADSAITHADPRCMLACAAFDAAIAAGLNHGREAQPFGPGAGVAIEGQHGTGEGDRSPRTAEPAATMLAAARAGLASAADRLANAWADAPADERALVDDARAALDSDLDASASIDPGVYNLRLHVHSTAGLVRVAFRLAFWHLVHTPSWRDAVVDVASRGGDADTNGAIVGALLGARDGAGAIPEAWIERVLGATQPGSPGWADAHHPRHFLALVR